MRGHIGRAGRGLPPSCARGLNLRTSEVVDTSAGKHGVVLNLRLAESGEVGGKEDELGLALAEGLEGGLVAKGVLSRLHDELELGVNGLTALLAGLSLRSHFD